MDIFEIINKRTSVRLYTNDPVPVEDLKKIVGAGIKAPSVNNSQPWKFKVITDSEVLKAMGRKVTQKIKEMFPEEKHPDNQHIIAKVDIFSTFFTEAPAVIAVTARDSDTVIEKLLPQSNLTKEDIDRMRSYPHYQSIGACIENMFLAAEAMEYGACWLTGLLIARDELEDLLNIREPYRLNACLAIGKPRQPLKPRDKIKTEDVFELI